jgi:hypothetical protein
VSEGEVGGVSDIKSYSVGFGDMFYINHNTDNFTIIDCCFNGSNDRFILDELAVLTEPKGITRFISTHPDWDHIRGLTNLDDMLGIRNFYCVDNDATKPDPTPDFYRYVELRDSEKAFHIRQGSKRRWMNQSDDERKSSGIDVLWPDVTNQHFKDAMIVAADGGTANNICPIVKYAAHQGVVALWMGDLETHFLENVQADLALPEVDILFAPHHGRDVVPEPLLSELSPQLIVIGEAAEEHLNDYADYNTLLQNSAGDIVFECEEGFVHVFTGKAISTPYLSKLGRSRDGYVYAGSFATRER